MSINRRSLLAVLAAATLAPCGLASQEATPDPFQDAVQTDALKRIMLYGDSNTWGFIPVEASPTARYDAETRWPGVLAAELGDGYEIVEEGLSARTTDVADPDLPQIAGAGLDGTATLSPIVASHLPLDLALQLRFSFDP